MVGSYHHIRDHKQVIAALQQQSFFRWSYEPELFPGIIINFGDITATYFRSGKVFFTGAKSEDDLDAAYCDLLLLV